MQTGQSELSKNVFAVLPAFVVENNANVHTYLSVNKYISAIIHQALTGYAQFTSTEYTQNVACASAV
jgi:hypothetical protein